MHKGKIAFVVGHERWGKSQTLSALTNGNFRLRRITIAGVKFFIRRMSNDDQPDGYIKFMKSINPARRPYLIAALCPRFNNHATETNSILSTLRAKGYQLFFWVIEHQYRTSAVVKTKEIKRLRKFGKVNVFSARAEAAARSASFKRFVSNVVRS